MIAAIETPVLCFVTDRNRCCGRSLEEVVSGAVSGGANMVHLREKGLHSQELLELAKILRKITRGSSLLFINGHLDVAGAVGADGVQLGEKTISVQTGRQMAPNLIIGRSIHSLEGAVQAESEGADLLIAGTVFASGSHPSGPLEGTNLLSQISEKVKLPLLGIGGISVHNAGSVIESGASGVAVITAISQSHDPKIAAEDIKDTMMKTWVRMSSRFTGNKY